MAVPLPFPPRDDTLSTQQVIRWRSDLTRFLQDVTTGGAVQVLDEGVSLTTAVSAVDFVGAGVTATAVGNVVTVTIPGGGGGSALQVLDEGVSLTAAATSMDFTGAGVTATAIGSAVTVNVAGGGGGGTIYFDVDPPAVAADYVAWWNTEEGRLKVYYADANTSQWVDAIAGATGPAGSNGTNGTNGTNGQGVPTGGTAGQVLEKIDGTDYNTQWATPGGGGAASYWIDNHPLAPPASPNAKDEEWNDGTGMSGPSNGLDASWTTFGAVQSRSYKNGKLVLTGTASGGVSPNATGMYKTAPGSPFKITAPVNHAIAGHYNYGGVGLRNSVSGKVLSFCFMQDTSGLLAAGVQLLRYTNPTTLASATTLVNFGATADMWLQVEYDGTNIIARYSLTGVTGTFIQHSTELASSFFSGGNLPDQTVITLDPFNVLTPVAVFGPVRVS